ncbi:MAG: peptide chain release factor 3 [Flavobacteriales bacterium]|nr:peptide chain release factor 3 [Flavobacteriales bacterium]
MSLEAEIARRRTFAIISHPDAGKTTLTEKLLLFGGAIQTAGAVKSNKIRKYATSDFMEIERQRGISVATSVMAFDYKGVHMTLLDTPGHKDFAEDTYRTLTAVDSVVLVVDAANGVEEQTERLMEVCRMRDTPVMIFINKMDREGKDPFYLMEELEKKLNIRVQPLTWPIGMGRRFKGVYNLKKRELNLYAPNKTRIADDIFTLRDLKHPLLDEKLGEDAAHRLREDVELIEGVYGAFSPEPYLKGELAPLFFGSALNNFGVQELLDVFVEIAPPPQPRWTAQRLVLPTEPRLTGFVFKIHANLDPRHRDRIAFFRVCSGKFERGKFYYHVRLGQELRFSNPTSFMAQQKSVIDEAWPGEVVGLYDTGNFKIGDTLTEGEELRFKGIPSFSPEIFKELTNLDPLRTKQLDKGIRQLTDEGVAQLFYLQPGQRKIVGTVGELQFEVLQYRLEHEYGARCRFVPLPIYKAVWISCSDSKSFERFSRAKAGQIATDKEGRPVFLAPSAWMLQQAEQDYPEIRFHKTSEF